jgi:hypothetical protein
VIIHPQGELAKFGYWSKRKVEKFPQSLAFFLKNFLCMSCTRFLFFGPPSGKNGPSKENAKFVNFIKASVVLHLAFVVD